MTAAWANPKSNKGECECQPRCGRYGTLGRPDQRGARHVRGCDCRVCLGRRNRRNGLRGQVKAAKALGIPSGGPLRPGQEEHYAGLVRTETKTGRQAKTVLTAYRGSEAQSEAQRPIGDHRPFVATFEPQGVSYGLVVIRTDRLTEAVAALAEQLGVMA